MSRYAGNPGAVEALVRSTEVHRDVYVGAEIFALERHGAARIGA
ncbi:MAG: hypothetical protein O2985_10500 [Proteobacteria bacterium]|nr:hypothetical protein [Pseudomonadota bacterium]